MVNIVENIRLGYHMLVLINAIVQGVNESNPSLIKVNYQCSLDQLVTETW